MRLRGKQDKFAVLFWSEVEQQVLENVTLTRIPWKLASIWSMSVT